MRKIPANKGLILVNALVFGVVAIIVTTALVNWGATTLKSTRQLSSREQALQIAEAGIDYYRWHLAHASTDYKDGTGTTTSNGPFIHDFKDKDGNIIGQFALTITPPPTGSTLVKILSKGTVLEDPNVYRKVQISLAIPSFAKYAVVANDFMNFGTGTEVFGPIHSNYGIHFDGLAHNIITSAVTNYVDPDVSVNKWAVYTTSGNDDPNPPTALPDRPDVFIAGRQFPVATVDFLGITASLSSMRSDAIAAGAAGRYYAASGAQGYHIILKTDDTYDIYRVTSLTSAPSGCTNSQSQTNWGTWSIRNQTLISSGVTFPANGIIFAEDHIWVDGQINTARLTIVAAAATFPGTSSTWKNILINNNLTYTNYDGTDSIALIAQGNVTAGLISADTMRVDAALMSQNGRIGRYYYVSSCGTSYKRASITLYGMLASALRYGFAYGTNISSGYTLRNITYDGNLLYSPPPSFPLTSNQYSILSWEEVK
jgi:type II secretory pathway pseudopilin PulG